MEMITIELRKLVPAEGYVLTNGETFSDCLTLGCNDSPDNWREITIEEAEKLKQLNIDNQEFI